MKVTIKNLNTTERISKKSQKAYTSMGIQTEEHGEAWLNGFLNDYNRDWKVGSIVNIEVEQFVKDGKTYLNFSEGKEDSAPESKEETPTETPEETIARLEAEKANLEGQVEDLSVESTE